jgi:hypothetical protein
MTHRFISQVEDDTSAFDGEIVTIVGEHPVQPPPDWRMPPVYRVTTKDGQTFAAFEDELEVINE